MLESPIAIDTNYVTPIFIVRTVFRMNYALRLKKQSLSLVLVSLTRYISITWPEECPCIYACNGVLQNAPLCLSVHNTHGVSESQLVSL